ncbi:adenylate cyclase [Stanieria cyanosphaera PCC 7437]|uniref:Adenylate cyclase n=1 Tax=Stanieria cyanosphaera (strain ATCC 29371 / PCC 7437) TaxID=111780 RepID=K9XYV6_STAC7|nr:CYTH domain-containing protein [Stanieria cyanosphaera]AFZ37785.1 adenylate cyclase [Stanieria cyanosphaera PCC 7437]
MPKEIERKYLVKGEQWRTLATGIIYRQGYIPTVGNQTVRVRLIDNQGYLTIKGPRIGISRTEFEYPIPLEDAQEMLLNLCVKPLIEKKRYKIKYQDLIWEVDEFFGENAGLIIAEVELKSENQLIHLPDWIDREVTDPKYFNSNLIKHPYSKWTRKH